VLQSLKHNQGTSGGYQAIVRDFAFNPKANRIATVGIGGEIRIWDTVAGTQVKELNNDSPEVWGVAFSPDGARLATGSPDGKIRLWDFETGQKLLTLEGSDERVNKLLFSPDGHQLIGRDFSAISFWDLDPGHEMFTQPENIAIEKVATDAAGTRLITGDDDGHIKIFESSTGRKLLDIPAHDAFILSVEFSPDGNFVASAGQDGSAKIWDTQSGALTAGFDGQNDVGANVGYDVVNNISYNAAGDRLAIFGCCNPSLNILDTATGKIARRIDLEAAPEWGNYDHAGDRLAIRTGEKIAILDADSGELLLTLNAHNGVVTGLAFSPDGRRLATASSDGLVKLWDVESGQLQLVINATRNSVWSVAFSPDGRYLYTGDQDGYLRSFILPLDDLISLAKTRVTRTFTPTECLEYRIDPCPSTP
jgi:WD40 repeat protein